MKNATVLSYINATSLAATFLIPLTSPIYWFAGNILESYDASDAQTGLIQTLLAVPVGGLLILLTWLIVVSCNGWIEITSTFQGRVSQRDYLFRFLAPSLAMIAAMVAFVAMSTLLNIGGGGGAGLIRLLVALQLPALAVGVRRFHDRGKSGWFMLIGLVPIIGAAWLLIELGFLRGQSGKNEYGNDPSGV